MSITSPPGFTLRHTLSTTKKWVNQVSWSRDGRRLASSFSDGTIAIWKPETGQLVQMLKGVAGHCLAWSPNGQVIASGGPLGLLLWNAETGELIRRHLDSHHTVNNVSWSPDGLLIATSSDMIRLWAAETGEQLQSFEYFRGDGLTWSPDSRTLAFGSGTIHLIDIETRKLVKTYPSAYVNNLAWSPDGKVLASTSDDCTIQLWDFWTGQQICILEGHTDKVSCASFSFDGRFLASKSLDGTIRLWHNDTKEVIMSLKDNDYSDKNDQNRDLPLYSRSLAFHPTASMLATTTRNKGRSVDIWDLDPATIFGAVPIDTSIHYTNAKVVLLGDSGVGKSGLGLVLTNKSFVPTESTHGRYVWTFDSQEVETDKERKEKREILLWDLAGQPGYRLVHQLHLNEVTIALVVFDARSETDPFAGVRHWNRALDMAQRVQANSSPLLKKFLVAGRIDRGGSGVSYSRIETLMHEMGFDAYFETSAKEGWGIKELIKAIQEAIDWSLLPKVSSTNLFQHIKTFLLDEKSSGRLLSTANDLYRSFLVLDNTSSRNEEIRPQFDACIRRVESRGLIRRLSFGNLVLLQSELLDIYASALVNVVKDEPDGLGSILEEKARNGIFRMSKDERINDKEQEKLLLIAMIEDLLRYEIVLREQGDDGTYLVFPSQSTRENPNIPDPKGKAVIFSFEGPLINIYATLAVRLSHSGLFRKKEMWKDAITYTAQTGGMCGLFLSNRGEGEGKLTLFFDEAVDKEIRVYFEDYVEAHLRRRALPESIKRLRIFICPNCGMEFTNLHIERRRELGYNWIRCSVCDTKVSLIDEKKSVRVVEERQELVSAMNVAADVQRELAIADTVFQGRIEFGDYDVFLCYNSEDKSRVKKIGEQLKKREVLPWLDEWELRPGLPWQRLLEQQIEQIKSAAVFVGKKGIGPWQQLEMEALLRDFAKRGKPVIPVLLPEAPDKPKLPVFLDGMTWVDFRKKNPSPISRLIWGITGKRTSKI